MSIIDENKVVYNWSRLKKCLKIYVNSEKIWRNAVRSIGIGRKQLGK